MGIFDQSFESDQACPRRNRRAPRTATTMHTGDDKTFGINCFSSATLDPRLLWPAVQACEASYNQHTNESGGQGHVAPSRI